MTCVIVIFPDQGSSPTLDGYTSKLVTELTDLDDNLVGTCIRLRPRDVSSCSVVPVGDLRSESLTVNREKVTIGCQQTRVRDFVRCHGVLCACLRLTSDQSKRGSRDHSALHLSRPNN
jgi:hypothetical protein